MFGSNFGNFRTKFERHCRYARSNPYPLRGRREALSGARGTGARAGDSGLDPAPRKSPRGRGVEVMPLCATTSVGTAATGLGGGVVGPHTPKSYVGRGLPIELGRMGGGQTSGRNRSACPVRPVRPLHTRVGIRWGFSRYTGPVDRESDITCTPSLGSAGIHKGFPHRYQKKKISGSIRAIVHWPLSEWNMLLLRSGRSRLRRRMQVLGLRPGQ